MLKKYFKDALQILRSESLKHRTKQTRTKDKRFVSIPSQTKALVKPETLAISGISGSNHEKYDTNNPVEYLKLKRILDTLMKKFVNPKLDLMVKFNQIKLMEANGREVIVNSLENLFKFESKSKIPTLPRSSSVDTVKTLAPEELTFGWIGQPTNKRITCKVETSTGRPGINDAFYTFPEVKEATENSTIKKSPLSSLRNTINERSNSRRRRRRATPIGKNSKLELSKDYTNENNIKYNEEVGVNPKRVQNIPVLPTQDGNYLKDPGFDKDNVHTTSNASEATKHDCKKVLVSDKSIELIPSLRSYLNDGKENPKPSQECSDTFKYKDMPGSVAGDSKDKIPNSVNGTNKIVVGKQQTNNLESRSNITQVVSESIKLNNTPDLERNRNILEGHIRKTDKINSYSPSNNEPKGSTSLTEDMKLTRYSLPMQKSSAVTETETLVEIEVLNHSQEEGRKALTMNNTLGVSLPSTNIATSKQKVKLIRNLLDKNNCLDCTTGKITEVNGLSSLEKGSNGDEGIIHEKTNIFNRKSINESMHGESKQNCFDNTTNFKVAHEALDQATGLHKKNLNIDVISANKVVTETKSLNNLNCERDVLKAKRNFSKNSLKELKNKQIMIQANYLKHVKNKAWFFDPYSKAGSRILNNGVQGHNNKTSLPKHVKIPENVKDMISKGTIFKAGSYKSRQKSFQVDKCFLNTGQNRQNKDNLALKRKPKVISSKRSGNFISKKTKKSKFHGRKSSPSTPPASDLTMSGLNINKVRGKPDPLKVKSLPNLVLGPPSCTGLSFLRDDKGHSKLLGFQNNVRTAKPEGKPLNQANSTNLIKSKSRVSLNDHTHLNSLKPTYVVKNKSVSSINEMTRKKKTFIYRNEAKQQPSNTTIASTLTINKTRKLHSRKIKPTSITLKMYGKETTEGSVDNKVSDIRSLKSVQIVKRQQESNYPSNISSNNLSLKNQCLGNKYPTKIDKNEHFQMKLHSRNFSTVHNANLIINKLFKRYASTTTDINKTLMPYNEIFQDKQNKSSVVPKQRIKLNSAKIVCPVIVNNCKNYKCSTPKGGIELKNALDANQSNQLLVKGSESKGGERHRRRHVKKSWKKKPKNSEILFEHVKQVDTSKLTDNISKTKPCNIEVIYRRRSKTVSNSSTELRNNGSENNIQAVLLRQTKMPHDKLHPFGENIVKENVCPKTLNLSNHMIKPDLDNCTNTAGFDTNVKMRVPPANNINEQPRRWKSKADRLNKWKSHKKENNLMTNSNHQLSNKSYIKTSRVENNEQPAPRINMNSVDKHMETNGDMERLVTSTNYKYPTPRHFTKYNTKNTSLARFKDQFVNYFSGNKTNCVRKENKGKDKNINMIENNCGKEETNKERSKFHYGQNKTLSRTEGKTNLALNKVGDLSGGYRSHEQTNYLYSKKISGKTKTPVNVAIENDLSSCGNCQNGCQDSCIRPKLNDGTTIISRPVGNTIQYYQNDSTISKLLSRANKDEAQRITCVIGSGESNNQSDSTKQFPKKFNPLVMKCFVNDVLNDKPQSSQSRNKSCNNNSPSKISDVNRLLRSSNSTAKDINLSFYETSDKKGNVSIKQCLVGTSDKLENAITNTKVRKRNKHLTPVGKTVDSLKANRKEEDCIPACNMTKATQIPNTKRNKDDSKHETKPPRSPYVFKTKPTGHYSFSNLRLSKSEVNRINKIKLKLTRNNKTMKINDNMPIKAVKSEENVDLLNERTKSLEKIKANVNLSLGQNKHTPREDLLRTMQILKKKPSIKPNLPKDESNASEKKIYEPILHKTSDIHIAPSAIFDQARPVKCEKKPITLPKTKPVTQVSLIQNIKKADITVKTNFKNTSTPKNIPFPDNSNWTRTSEVIGLIPTLVTSQKIKNREQQAHGRVLVHPIEQEQVSHEPPFKVKGSTYLNLKSPDLLTNSQVRGKYTSSTTVADLKDSQEQKKGLDSRTQVMKEKGKLTHVLNGTNNDTGVSSVKKWVFNLGLEPECI